MTLTTDAKGLACMSDQLDFKLGVIFDCDGTLLDSTDVWHSVEEDLAQRGNGTLLSKADHDLLTTMTIAESATFLHEKFEVGIDGLDVQHMIAEFMHDYYAHKSIMRPGVKEFVEGLAHLGVPMACASSTPSDLLHEGLEHVGLAPFFRVIVSVDDVHSSKRDPKVYDTARKALDTTRSETWGFEDAIYAIRTLKAAGYRTMGVYDSDGSGTYADLSATATRVLRTFEDITSQEFVALARRIAQSEK